MGDDPRFKIDLLYSSVSRGKQKQIRRFETMENDTGDLALGFLPRFFLLFLAFLNRRFSSANQGIARSCIAGMGGDRDSAR